MKSRFRATNPNCNFGWDRKVPCSTSKSIQKHPGALTGALLFLNFDNYRYINALYCKFHSESGTTIHKASLQSGAFSFLSYGRFLVVATRYLFAGFLAIFADVRYFYTPQHPLMCLFLTPLLRSFYGPLRFLSLRLFIMKQRIRGKWGIS